MRDSTYLNDSWLTFPSKILEFCYFFCVVMQLKKIIKFIEIKPKFKNKIGERDV